MNNKVIVKLIVPEIDITYDIFIPVNELVWKVKKLIAKSIFDLTNGAINPNAEYTLINKTTSIPYNNNDVIINTDIRNATELIFLSVKESHVEISSSDAVQTEQTRKFIN